MKKSFIILILALAPLLANACDVCGSGAGGNYLGILPEFSKHIIGLRYRSNTLATHLGKNGTQTYLTSYDTYRTTELWGGWNIRRNIRVMAALPYNFNARKNQGTSKEKNGLGDVSISGFYRVLDRKRMSAGGKLFTQSIWTGIGLKMPTGKYNAADKTQNTQNANLFQLGTGSFDATVNVIYDARLQDAGLNVWGSYKINTANKYGYRYGNKLALSLQPYYKFSIGKKIMAAPNVGIQFEMAQQDTDSKFAVDASGGQILLGTIGAELVFKKISFGANYQLPLSQNLALGIVSARNRGMAHVSFAL